MPKRLESFGFPTGAKVTTTISCVLTKDLTACEPKQATNPTGGDLGVVTQKEKNWFNEEIQSLLSGVEFRSNFLSPVGGTS